MIYVLSDVDSIFRQWDKKQQDGSNVVAGPRRSEYPYDKSSGGQKTNRLQYLEGTQEGVPETVVDHRIEHCAKRICWRRLSGWMSTRQHWNTLRSQWALVDHAKEGPLWPYWAAVGVARGEERGSFGVLKASRNNSTQLCQWCKEPGEGLSISEIFLQKDSSSWLQNLEKLLGCQPRMPTKVSIQCNTWPPILLRVGYLMDEDGQQRMETS